MPNLIELEMRGWQAVSSGRETAQGFYRTILADDAVMVLPDGMLLRGKDEILKLMGLQLWESFRFDETWVMPLSENASVIVYRVTAKRKGSDPYIALISSVYVAHHGQWKLTLHQQTPV